MCVRSRVDVQHIKIRLNNWAETNTFVTGLNTDLRIFLIILGGFHIVGLHTYN